MPVDRRLDFFRVDLQTADVDEAAAPAEEVVPVTTAFHHVAGVDEAVVIAERGVVAERAGRTPSGAEAQRTVLDFNLHVASRADQARGKPFQTIVDVESDAGFR